MLFVALADNFKLFRLLFLLCIRKLYKDRNAKTD